VPKTSALSVAESILIRRIRITNQKARFTPASIGSVKKTTATISSASKACEPQHDMRIKDNWRNQAITQACAVCSPFAGVNELFSIHPRFGLQGGREHFAVSV
jgi:hypothetical protein